MAVIVKKSLIFRILFALCIGVPYLSNYELTFAIWLFTAFVTLNKSYSFTFLKYATCFLVILVIAIVVTDYGNVNSFFLVRDFTYLLKPVIGLFLGYQICRYTYENAFKTIIYIGCGIALIHLTIILITFLSFFHISVALIRIYAGYFSDYEVYALIILLFYKKFEIDFSRKQFWILTAIIGTSAFLYLARTNFIQFFILYIGLKGYFIINRKSIIAISSIAALTLISYVIILSINPKRNGDGIEEFLYKIKIAPTEPFKTKIDLDDYKDFNDNYRSVELILTLKQTANKSRNEIFFGQGLGSQVDLKKNVFLGDMSMRFISVLHNCFMTTLLKSGIVGILILLYSIFLIYNQKGSPIPIVHQINLLLMGTGVFLLVSNWVLMGYYFTQDSKSILVGFLIAYREITHKNQTKLPSETHPID